MVRANQKKPSQKVKYLLFICLLMACLFGLNLMGIMDPISFFFRSVALALLPGLGLAIGGVFSMMAQSDIKAFNLLNYGA